MIAITRSRIAALVLALLAAANTQAQNYPNRVVRFVVSAAAGSTPDLVGRLFAQHLAEEWKQPVIVENRSGANGALGAEMVARAAPDGYTFLVATAGTLTTNPFLYPKMGPLVITGLAPVTKLVNSDFFVAARGNLGVRSVQDLVRMIRANPGRLNSATSQAGSAAYLGNELFKQSGNMDYTVVPHSGGAASATAVAGGHADFTINTLAMIDPLLHSGKLVMLASMGSQRNSRTPGVPTLSESGFPGLTMTGWIALMAPKGTPEDIISTVHSRLAQVAQRQEVRAKLLPVDLPPVANTPRQFAAEWHGELQMWEKVIKAAGINLD